MCECCWRWFSSFSCAFYVLAHSWLLCLFFASFPWNGNDTACLGFLANRRKMSQEKEARCDFQVKEFSIIGKVFKLIVCVLCCCFGLNVRACSNHHNTFKCTSASKHVAMPSSLYAIFRRKCLLSNQMPFFCHPIKDTDNWGAPISVCLHLNR